MRTSALRLESELLFHHEITGFAPENAGYGGRSEGAREPVEGDEAAEASNRVGSRRSNARSPGGIASIGFGFKHR